jgi:hypothetical protein
VKCIRIQCVIDGQHFDAVSHAFAAAKERGFDGGEETFNARLRRGATTWSELLAPVQPNGKNGASKRATHRAEEKALMAQLCAELDARKAALKEVA